MRVSVADAIAKLLASSGIAQAVNPRGIGGQQTRRESDSFRDFAPLCGERRALNMRPILNLNIFLASETQSQ
jgi:hypothetical protein